VAGREGEAARVHEPGGRARPAAERLEGGGNEGREALREHEREQGEPPARGEQHRRDGRDRDEAPGEAAEPV
jgi:hypothetical protein